MAADGAAIAEVERLIEDQVQEWSTSSNEAFTVSVYQGDDRVQFFNPTFTYPIYGEEEVIFGYQGLEIELAFASHNLTPHLRVKYNKKFPAQGEIQAGDVVEPLEDFLPPAAFAKGDRASALSDADASSFVPPGEKIRTLDSGDETYEVWCSSLSNPRTKQILQNMQILVPLFIEGGTILELEYDWIVGRWKVFLLYQVTQDPPPGSSPYVFAGYATSFQVFTLPEREDPFKTELGHISQQKMDDIIGLWSADKSVAESPLSLPSRERISQFIILPAYQKYGLGSRLYSAAYDYLTAPSNVIELTVEDPNEDFDAMRDLADLAHLRRHNTTFTSLSIPKTIPSAALSSTSTVPTSSIVPSATRIALAKETKIQPRQLSRLVEMQLLSTIPKGHRTRNRITRKERSSNDDDRRYYFWRLLVKDRLFAHNRDTLVQLEPEERLEKVDEAVERVQWEYELLLDKADERARRGGAGKAGDRVRRLKKRVAEDDADEDGGASNGVEVAGGSAAEVEVEGEDGEEHAAGGGARKKRKRAIVEDDEAEDV